MNRILLALAALVTSGTSFGQIVTLEHSYYPSTYGQTVKLEDEGDKYMLFDTTTKKYSLYNPDHSLWKTLNFTLPANARTHGIQCVSTKLFNNDSKVEYSIYHAYLQTSPAAWIYTTDIADEDGNILQSLPGIAGLSVFKMDGKWKVAGTNNKDYMWHVFSVPGTMPDPAITSDGPDLPDAATMYPNPMSEKATLEYKLPTGLHEGYVEIISQQGQILKTYKVTDQFQDIIISRGDLPSGTYIYRVSGGQARPFVIR